MQSHPRQHVDRRPVQRPRRPQDHRRNGWFASSRPKSAPP